MKIINNQEYINFKKTRDLGAIITDTFKFLNEEWKPFFGTILKISIVPILIAIAVFVYYAMTSLSFYGDLAELQEYGEISNFNFSRFFLPLLALIFAYLISYALITVSSLSYVKSYIENKGIVNFDDIQKSTKKNFWPYIGLFFLIGIMVCFGLIFCFIPGIYLAVVLSLSLCLLIFQNKGVLDSINDSFSFIKNHWWETFGILLVIQILIGIASFIIDLPASMYQGLDMATILENPDSIDVSSSFSDPIYLILIAFSYIAKFILYIVSTISIVFIYYDIKEQKNPSSDVIDEIGSY